jgi:anthranilate phosphoribosyltransferase
VAVSLVDGIALARQAIASGAARRTLDALVKATHAA